MQTLGKLLLVALSLIGLADATYLTYEKLAGVIPPCSPGFNCENVLSSQWASVGPVPLSALGMGYYAVVLVLACIILLEIPFKLPVFAKVTPLQATVILTSLGFATSIGLVGLMAFVIESWCLYCLISAGTSTGLFLCSSLLWWPRKGQFK